LQGWPDNVHLFTAKPESVVVQQGGQPLARVHGISYPKKETSEDLAAKLKREGDEPFQLGLVHATVGAHAGHANYAPTTMDTLVRSGLDYWALGHVHTHDTLREADPVVAYPGNLQALSPRETGPRGALVVRVDEQGNTGLDFRPLDRVRFATERVDITDTDTLSAIATKLEEAAGRLRNEANASALVVRATLTGQSACFSKLSDPGKMDGLLETLRENQAQADPPLWWSRIVNEATPPLDLEQLKAQGGLEADLITLTETLLADPALLEKLADETWQPLYAKSGATKLTGERPSAQALAEELLEARDLALALLREEVS
jgi:DNA repair exonuclease SbcCD nuclease subunit